MRTMQCRAELATPRESKQRVTLKLATPRESNQRVTLKLSFLKYYIIAVNFLPVDVQIKMSFILIKQIHIVLDK